MSASNAKVNDIIFTVISVIALYVLFPTAYGTIRADWRVDFSNEVRQLETLVDSLNRYKDNPRGFKDIWETAYYVRLENLVRDRVLQPFQFVHSNSYFDNFQNNKLIRIDTASGLQNQRLMLSENFQIVNKIDSFIASEMTDSLFNAINKHLQVTLKADTLYVNLSRTHNSDLGGAAVKIDIRSAANNYTSIIPCLVITDTLFSFDESDFVRLFPRFNGNWGSISHLSKLQAIEWGSNLPYATLPDFALKFAVVDIDRHDFPYVSAGFCLLFVLLSLRLPESPLFRSALQFWEVVLVSIVVLVAVPILAFFLPLVKIAQSDVIIVVLASLVPLGFAIRSAYLLLRIHLDKKKT